MAIHPPPPDDDMGDATFVEARERVLQASGEGGRGRVRGVLVKDIISNLESTSTLSDAGEEQLVVVGKLISRQASPRLWSSLFIEDETGSIRACFLEPDIAHLDGMVVLTRWRRVVATNHRVSEGGGGGDASRSSTGGTSGKSRGGSEASSVRVREGVYLEVSGYRPLGPTSSSSSRKRRREEAGEQEGASGSSIPRFTEGIRVCGRAMVVSPIVPRREDEGGPWSVVIVAGQEEGETFPIFLHGQSLPWHPFLRVDTFYLFPMLHEAPTPTHQQQGQAGFPTPHVLVTANHGGRPPPPPVQMIGVQHASSQGLSLGAFDNATGLVWTKRRGLLAAPPEGEAPPNTMVLSYEGTIKALHRGALYELESLADGDGGGHTRRRRFYLLLACNPPDLGAGLRPGARVRVDNVHPLCLWGELQAFGVCLYSQLRVTSFSEVKDAPYKVPDATKYTSYCLTLLEWSRRVRVALRDKVVGGINKATNTSTAGGGGGGGGGGGDEKDDWFEKRLVQPWSERLAVFGPPDRSDKIKEVVLHACGHCPVPLGGLPTVAGGSLSPPLPAVPKLREVRRVIRLRLEALIAREGWLPVLSKGRGNDSPSSPYQHAFVVELTRAGHEGHDEEEEEEDREADLLLPQPSVVMGWLAFMNVEGGNGGENRRQLVIQDLTGTIPLVVGGMGAGQQAFSAPEWMVRQAEANECPARRRDMVAVKVNGEAAARVVCEIIRPPSQSPDNTVSLAAREQQQQRVATHVEVPLLPGAGVLHVRPYLMAPASAIMTVKNDQGDAMHRAAAPSSSSAVPASASLPALQHQTAAQDRGPPSVVPLSEILSKVQVANVRAQPAKAWAVPCFHAKVIIKEERSKVLHLLCRAVDGVDVISVKLPTPALASAAASSSSSSLSSSSSSSSSSSRYRTLHETPDGGLPSFTLGCIVAFVGMSCGRGDSGGGGGGLRHLALTAGPNTSIRVVGYRAVTRQDYRLVHLTHEVTMLPLAILQQPGNSSSREEWDPFLPSMLPLGHISSLVPQTTVCCALMSLLATIIVFNDVKLTAMCSCRGPKAATCSSHATYKWSVQCTVDDGTARATAWADGEAAVALLGLQRIERQRLEAAALTRSSDDEWPSWLRKAIFADEEARPRRLRRVRITAREILANKGKGDGQPPPTIPFRKDQSSSSSSSEDRSSRRMLWSYHMPILKVVMVAEEEQPQFSFRNEAYHLLHHLQKQQS